MPQDLHASPLYRPTNGVISAVNPLTRALMIAGIILGVNSITVPYVFAADAVQNKSDIQSRHFNIPPGTVDQVLNNFAKQSKIMLVIDPGLTAGKNSPGLNGDYTQREGLNEILHGKGLDAEIQEDGSYTLKKIPLASIDSSSPATLAEVSVTAKPDKVNLPQVYAGGQVAKGGKVGLLGDKDFMDTPFNMITYTAKTIEDQQARTMADVLDNNPAFRSIYPNNDAIMDFNVRGNKVKALDAAYGGLYGLMSPGVESLERIEVIIGANALLNGLGPVGGVGGSINLVPKRALDTPLTRVTTQFISDSQVGVLTDISRRFGPDDKFGVRFNSVYTDGDTSVDTQSRRVTMGTLALDYKGDQIRLNADLGYRKNDSNVPSRTTYVQPGFNIPSAPDSSKSWQQRWTYDKTEVLTGALRGEYDISPDLTAYAAIGASRFRETELFANSFLLAANGSLFQRQVYWPLYRDNKTAEAGIRGHFETGPVKHNWAMATSGLWIENGITLNTVANTSTNIYNPVFINQPSINGLPGPSAVPKTGSTTLSGVAVSDTLSILDERVQLTLGLRRQNVESNNYNPTTGAVTSSYDKSVTTPGVGIVFKALSNVSLYANYIEGLQQGPVATGGSNVGQIFAPYVSKQEEVGIKVDFGRIATTLSVYQLKTPNGMVNPTTNVYGVDGEQRTRGIELNTFGQIVDNVRLLGGVVFVDAKQTKTAGGVTDGNQVTGAPDTQLNLGTEWDVTGLPGLTLSARAIYTSSQYLDLLNRQSIPSWTRYDAGARYQTRLSNIPTTLRVNVQNLLDKSYWSAAVDGYLVQSTPRTVMLSATFDF